MKYRQIPQLFAAIILLLLAGCSNQTSPFLVASTPSPSTSSTVAPVVQQPLPKGLLNAKYPVMDWVFNQTCGFAFVDIQARAGKAAFAHGGGQGGGIDHA